MPVAFGEASLGVDGLPASPDFPEAVLGIELNTYAAELARVTIWIGYLQWMLGNGFGYSEPVLDPLDSIRLQDSLLDFSGDEVKEATWPDADFIIGNPPFLGGNKVRQELGDAYLESLFVIFEGRVPRFADLCCYFFEKARANIEQGDSDRAGLLATNSIRGGYNRDVLRRIKESGDIYVAWSDEPWILDGAAVRISIVGFDGGRESPRYLDGKLVDQINSDLTALTDITLALPLLENSRLCFMGPSPKGPFDIDVDQAMQMLAGPVNVNGRPNSDVIRQVVSAIDIVRHSRNLWTIDFGLMDQAAAAMYEQPFEWVLAKVKPVREANRRDNYRLRWWQYGEARPGLRAAVAGKRRQVVTPAVSKHRVFVWLPIEVLCNQGTLVFARDDDYFFGVLHSRVHEVWSLRMGTWLGKGNDPRYTLTTCFETFPLPWPPGSEPVDNALVIAIGEAARRLNELRENWLNPEGASEAELKKRTLTNLYNQRPTWLVNAHATLDRPVWAAYGWDDLDPSTVEEDVILSRLLALNLERSTAETRSR